jgi:hypothetical protein
MNGTNGQPGQPCPAENGRAMLLPPKQEQVALLLAGGASDLAVARATKVGARTIRTWRATLPYFNFRVEEIRRELCRRVAGVLVQGMIDASWTLRRLLKSKKEMVRLKAADSLLTHGTAMTALAELQERVAQLENR